MNTRIAPRTTFVSAMLLLAFFTSESQWHAAAQTTGSTRRSKAAQVQPLERLKIIWRPGEEQRIEDLKGKVVVLFFWSHKSMQSVKALSAMMDIVDRFTNAPITWIAIHDASLSTIEELDQKLSELKRSSGRQLNMLAALDQRHNFPVGGFVGLLGDYKPEDQVYRPSITADRFGIYRLPGVVLIDPSTRESKSVATDEVERMIRQLLAR